VVKTWTNPLRIKIDSSCGDICVLLITRFFIKLSFHTYTHTVPMGAASSTHGRDHSEDVGVDGKIILEWILEKQGGKLWTGFMCFRTGISG
jgi:hypothetical protein